ncbi:hypothetical protein [Cronobacter sakazakii]|uniref:hypothetical protein n=1 Tax=Cronobacter sakazakii TaxID=28141 RepID=UPI000DA206EC|nr:hypothetical protein [Cronobacter sakazakii]
MSEIDYERVQFLHDVATECARDGTEIALDADEVILYLTEPLLALRERAEPVYQVQAMDWHDVEKYLYDEALDRGIRCRVLYTAPTAPVVTAETFEEWSRRCEIQLTLCRPEFREVAEITWNACLAAMLEAPGKDG